MSTAADDQPAALPEPDQQQWQIEVEYFTDPLCCWSWSLEPQWRRLRYELRGHLTWRYRMAGMLPNWQSYADPVNSINRPSQMGPLWYQARELSGMPIQDRLWLIDPPQSSYPACIAVKAAEMQSRDAAERYLRRLREAVMMEQQNIAKREVLLQLSDQTAEQWPQLFDAQQFAADLNSREAEDAFREDLRHARYLGIGRYPTLILRRTGSEQGLLLTGYRPYKSLLAAVQHLYPQLQPAKISGSYDAYRNFWRKTLDQEIQELNAADC